MRCPVLDYFVTSQLRPFHAECPDPGHGTRNYVSATGDRMRQLIIYCFFRMYSGFYSTSRFYI